jgi:Family of unknown function (DUF5681)
MERDTKGKFSKGTSGNRNGRPRAKSFRLETPNDVDEAIIRIMNRPTNINLGGRLETVTLFEYNVVGLASGAVKNRLAAKSFVDLAKGAVVSRDLRQRVPPYDVRKKKPHG